jgi:putative two-component system response regulator
MKQVLIVDDMRLNVSILANIITEMGLEPLPAYNVEEAFGYFRDCLPQIILLDVSMPQMDGYEFCSILKKNAVTRDIPVIFISAMDTIQDKLKGLELGAADFITKPFASTEVTMRVKNHLESRQMKQELQHFNHRLHKMLTEQMEKYDNEKKAILCALTAMISKRKGMSDEHLELVSYNSRVLARGLQLSEKITETVTEEFIENIGPAAKLHDIGYLWNEDESEEEHCLKGAEILENLLGGESSDEFKDMALAVVRYHHHDYADKKTELPVEAKIVRITIAFDHLIRRLRESGVADDELASTAVAELMKGGGTAYDPTILEILNKIQRHLQIG